MRKIRHGLRSFDDCSFVAKARLRDGGNVKFKQEPRSGWMFTLLPWWWEGA